MINVMYDIFINVRCLVTTTNHSAISGEKCQI